MEGKRFETLDLSGLVLREGILHQCFKCFCLSEGVGEGGGVGRFDIVLR